MEKRECSTLENGWKREVVFRKSGLTAGRADVYFYSPDGKRFRSRTQVKEYLGDKFVSSEFNFSVLGATVTMPATRRPRPRRTVDTNTPFARALKALPKNIDRPERTYCGLVRQPVTCLLPRSHDIHLAKKAPTRPSALTSALPVPRQVHYERRLFGTPAIDSETGRPVSNLAYEGNPPPVARVPLRPAQTRAAPTSAVSSAASSKAPFIAAGVNQSATGRQAGVTMNGLPAAAGANSTQVRGKPLAALPRVVVTHASTQRTVVPNSTLARLPPPTQQQQQLVKQQVPHQTGYVTPAPPRPAILAHNVRQQVVNTIASRSVTGDNTRVVMPQLYSVQPTRPTITRSVPARPTVGIQPTQTAVQPVTIRPTGQPVTVRVGPGSGSGAVPMAGMPLTLQNTGRGNWAIMAPAGRPPSQVVIQPQKTAAPVSIAPHNPIDLHKVTDQDILRQEERVRQLQQKLASAQKAL